MIIKGVFGGNLKEMFDNIKFITLTGKEQKFLFDFNKSNYATADIAKKQNFIQQMPRLFFELLTVLSLIISCGFSFPCK